MTRPSPSCAACAVAWPRPQRPPRSRRSSSRGCSRRTTSHDERGMTKDDAEAILVDVSGRQVRVTHPDKIYFKERNETKLDLIRYYQAVEEPLLRTMQNRPVMLQRFPSGASGGNFYQKRIPENAPAWLQSCTVSTPNGTLS